MRQIEKRLDSDCQIRYARPMNENTTPAPVRAHQFGGIDGRCFGCDIRPSSRHAGEPCPNY